MISKSRGELKDGEISEGTRFVFTPLCYSLTNEKKKKLISSKSHWSRFSFRLFFLTGRLYDEKDISLRKSNYTPSYTFVRRLGVGSWIKNLCMNTLTVDKKRNKSKLSMEKSEALNF